MKSDMLTPLSPVTRIQSRPQTMQRNRLELVSVNGPSTARRLCTRCAQRPHRKTKTTYLQNISTMRWAQSLFEAICQLPEYYLTRAETEILRTCADEIAGALIDSFGRRSRMGGLCQTRCVTFLPEAFSSPAWRSGWPMRRCRSQKRRT